MTTEELYRHLLAFNEDEKFYESYYDAHKKQWKLEEFLKSLDYHRGRHRIYALLHVRRNILFSG